jgi:GNAT superfamily N-acetyltransferase
MNAAFRIRAAAPADAGAIAGLHAESWRLTYRGILPDAYLDGPVAAERLRLWTHRLALPEPVRPFVALAECDVPAGFVCVLPEEDPAWGLCLDNLHVLPAFRSQGLGRALMAEAARWAAATAPGRPLHLWVFAANRSAIAFYERLGAEAVERRIKAAIPDMAAPSVRYVWRDLGALTRGQASR